MNVAYTDHGHGYPAPPGEPDQPKPRLMARCGGPTSCLSCSRQAGWGDSMGPGGAYLPANERQLAALHRDDQ